MNCVAASWDHSLFLDSTGSVWSCGNNQYGQLGLGDTTNRNQPVKIGSLPRIVSVSAGSNFSVFLDHEGVVWSCGNNEYGRLGLGNTSQRKVPVKIESLPKIKSIYCLYHSCLFLDIDGSVWSCGNNQYGQLGLGDMNNRNQPEKITGIPKIRLISSGCYHACLLDVSGNVWICGHNTSGNLGLGDALNRNVPVKIPNLPKIKSVSGGIHFTLFLDFEGFVWSCGSNSRGELGVGDKVQRNKPVKIETLSQIVATAGGYNCSLFLDKSGNIFGCGHNEDGQLGLGDNTDRSLPAKVQNLPKMASICSAPTSQYFFLSVDCEGNVWSAGYNGYGQLGLGDSSNRSQFTKINGLPRVAPKSTANHAEIKQIFLSLAKEQSKQLIETIKASYIPDESEKDDFFRLQILTGNIPMIDWSTRWIPIHTKNQELSALIDQHRTRLVDHQKKLKEIQARISKIQQQLAIWENEKETLDFYDEFLEPVVLLEKEITESFHAKLRNPQEFSVDDVSVFLQMCSLGEVVDLQRQKSISGDEFISFSSISDMSELGITDALTKKKLKFYAKLLENGLFKKQEILLKSVIWRHIPVNKTLEFLREIELKLDEEVIKEKEISVCQLIYFKIKDFREIFGIDGKEAVPIMQQLKSVRRDFKQFLLENQVGNSPAAFS